MVGSNGTDSMESHRRWPRFIRSRATSLLALVEASPVLLVFLRHFGCSFCRQAISDVADLEGRVG